MLLTDAAGVFTEPNFKTKENSMLCTDSAQVLFFLF